MPCQVYRYNDSRLVLFDSQGCFGAYFGLILPLVQTCTNFVATQSPHSADIIERKVCSKHNSQSPKTEEEISNNGNYWKELMTSFLEDFYLGN